MTMEKEKLITTDAEYEEIAKLYDECLNYLNEGNLLSTVIDCNKEPDYESIEDKTDNYETTNQNRKEEDNEDTTEKVINKTVFKLENEKSTESLDSVTEPKSNRLRKLSQQLPKIIITNSLTSLGEDAREKEEPALTRNMVTKERRNPFNHVPLKNKQKRRNVSLNNGQKRSPPLRYRPGYGDYPRRLVSKSGSENVALISNIPFERIRLLNDTFHTLINLRWRWIVIGTIVVHFAIWLVFAVFWYITALAHYDFEPDPPSKPCITGGKDFVTIFLASVEAQTTIGFGDRAIDEECPESIFLFVMQLILGTGLSGVLTCVVYAKLTRPEKLSRDGVGFSKKAVICLRDGNLCLMMRAWDLNYDHIINSEFTAHFVNTHRTKEGEMIRYYAKSLALLQRQFLLWPVTLVHVIDENSPLYGYSPEFIANNSFEITLSLKGASASMGTFTQSQTSYLPKEVAWGYRFPPVVKYDVRKQKYVIDHKKLDTIEPVDTPHCSARELQRSTPEKSDLRPSTPSSFSEMVSGFQLERSSSFRNKSNKT